MGDVRVTVVMARVLLQFLADVDRYRYGQDLAEATGLLSGVLSPLLARLYRAGWLEREDEVGDPRVLGRRLRRYYRLRPGRVEEVRAAVAATTEQVAGWLTPPTV